ncbi:hypothetical protein VTO73DRAFT_1758 [Trametes versicolor]
MEILEASIKLLEIAKLVTADIPVPGLNTALECALSIAKKAKEIKDTRDECRALAQRAADLVLIIYEQLKNDSGQTAAKEHVTMFLHNLLDIENLMVRRLQAGTGERILFAFNIGKIAKEVQTLTARLEESYRNFMIQAALSIHQSMDTLTSGNVRMLQHIDDSAHVGEAVLGDTRKIRTDLTDLALRVGASAMFDGNFRLFARENLTFLEPIVELAYKSHHAATQQRDEHTAIQATARPRTGRVFRYRAIVKAAGELSGTNVVVYTYPNRGIERFTEAIKFAKQSCHPYVPAILGYSRPGGPGEAAYIVTEDYLPFVDYVSSLRGTSKLRAYLQMRVATCMVVDHLEMMELHQLLPTNTFWDSRANHRIRLDEVVYDDREGRIKWVWDPLLLERPHPGEAWNMYIPTAQRHRQRIAEDHRAVASSRVDTAVQHWLSLVLKPVGLHRSFALEGRSWLRYWDDIVDYPRHPLGVWLGPDSDYEDWTCLSANPGFEVTVQMQIVPYVLPSPWQDEGCEFWQRLSMREWFYFSESDLGEMCIEYELGTGENQKRWKRYQFSYIPVNTTFLFQQWVHVLDELDAASRMIRSLPDLTCVLESYPCIGIVPHRYLYTETTITMGAHAAAEQVFPPLWFFALQFDSGDNFAHDCNIPCGFWSSDKYPTSIPADIIFDPTPQSEPVWTDIEAPLFTSTQILGDLIFTTQTKMETMIKRFSEDELLAFRELQFSHHS